MVEALRMWREVQVLQEKGTRFVRLVSRSSATRVEMEAAGGINVVYVFLCLLFFFL